MIHYLLKAWLSHPTAHIVIWARITRRWQRVAIMFVPPMWPGSYRHDFEALMYHPLSLSLSYEPSDRAIWSDNQLPRTWFPTMSRIYHPGKSYVQVCPRNDRRWLEALFTSTNNCLIFRTPRVCADKFIINLSLDNWRPFRRRWLHKLVVNLLMVIDGFSRTEFQKLSTDNG